MPNSFQTFICRHCGVKRTLWYKRIGKPTFCDNACYVAYRNAHKGPPQKRAQATCHPDRPLAALGLCSTCYWRQDRAAKPEAYLESARRYCLKKKYGVSLEEFDEMYLAQDGRCAICQTPSVKFRGLDLDHDHATKAVRALLCRECNTGLGKFKDSPVRLAAAMAYLLKHRVVA